MDSVVYTEHIEGNYEIIGYVTVNAERRQEMREVMRHMKREAALLGGNAFTDIHTDASGRWKRLPAQKLIGNAYVRANFKAAVVVLK